MNTIINLLEKTYYFLWGDWIHLPLPGGTTINLPLLVLLLVPTGIFCTIRTRFLQIRMLPDMLRALLEKAETGHKGGSLSARCALIVQRRPASVWEILSVSLPLSPPEAPVRCSGCG